MGSQYASSYPEGVTFSPQYKDFFQHFYQISDTPDAHEQYSQQFTKDATLVMASKTAKGQEGTLPLTLLLGAHLFIHSSQLKGA